MDTFQTVHGKNHKLSYHTHVRIHAETQLGFYINTTSSKSKPKKWISLQTKLQNTVSVTEIHVETQLAFFTKPSQKNNTHFVQNPSASNP